MANICEKCGTVEKSGIWYFETNSGALIDMMEYSYCENCITREKLGPIVAELKKEIGKRVVVYVSVSGKGYEVHWNPYRYGEQYEIIGILDEIDEMHLNVGGKELEFKNIFSVTMAEKGQDQSTHICISIVKDKETKK